MNFLLTGSAGFVGSHVARDLVKKGHNVRAHLMRGESLERISDIKQNLELVEGDLFNCTEAQLDELSKDINICIHCAWHAIPGKYLDSEENLKCLDGSVKLFRQLGKAGCKRCVGIGTCFEYDLTYGYLSEETPAKPGFLYSAAKTATYLMGKQISENHNMSFAWPRLFYLYGPHENQQRLMPYVISSVLQNKPAQIGPGTQVRDYMHIEDAASAITAVSESSITGAVNIGSGTPVQILGIAKTICGIIGKPELLEIGARKTNPDDPAFICANNTKLSNQTQWKPLYNLETGLEQTIQWWKDNLPIK